MKTTVLILVMFAGLCYCQQLRRIIGGYYAAEDQFPYQVALFLLDGFGGRQFICGGSIISEQFILTAAHCVDDNSYNFEILAGTRNLQSDFGQRVKVKKRAVHEEWNSSIHDIAILMLEQPLEFNEKVQSIELQEQEVKIGSGVIIMGWGQISPDGPHPNILKYNDRMKVQSTEMCLSGLNPGLICLGSPNHNGACHVNI